MTAHTASLFPGTAATGGGRLQCSRSAEGKGLPRVTFTARVLSAARQVGDPGEWFLANSRPCQRLLDPNEPAARTPAPAWVAPPHPRADPADCRRCGRLEDPTKQP